MLFIRWGLSTGDKGRKWCAAVSVQAVKKMALHWESKEREADRGQGVM